ncbi:Mg-chelatase subunit ChlI [Corynebacterium mustelae]|uniref:Mg-chelatase subunit ChlI n=1 Tax=Corynebacterium mustelae TaxID=571915 RepID=A0A0G3H0C5_9CORY|nr:AAA family ATPase [Corynebacterium mustelae]AKK06200.1 Mg-chelatase subunit ChlI [Corynebacterium mustelae]
MTSIAPVSFPFSAVVGQDQLHLALILTAVSPRIGGVVIRGEKGTAKTTTVRAFAKLLDGAPLINLPIGATEDRVVGALDLETVLTTGRATYKPGLLAQANNGVLYVDEVNLLADHLIDALLDAAATGIVTIERDGISHTAEASFVLVGTMNPEEGELRPQLLDRFGLSVEVTGSRDVDIRADIIRRRLAFEQDPAGFVAQWAEADNEIAKRIKQAKELLPHVTLSDVNLARIAHICAAFDVDGMRADLVIARTACAHAAWQQRTNVTDEDIKVAAELALPHRKRRNPFDEPGIDQQDLDNALEQAQNEHPEDDLPADAPSATPEPDTQDLSDSQATADGEVGTADQGVPFRRSAT